MNDDLIKGIRKRSLSLSDADTTISPEIFNTEAKKWKVDRDPEVGISVEPIRLHLNGKKMICMKKKELEKTILRLFIERCNNDHDLGKCKELCTKLEANLGKMKTRCAQQNSTLEQLRLGMHGLLQIMQHHNVSLRPMLAVREVGIQTMTPQRDVGIQTDMAQNPLSTEIECITLED